MFQLFQRITGPGLTQDMTLEQVRLAFLQLLAEVTSNHHRMGQLYNHVVANKLAEKAGYKTALDYFSQNLHEVSRSALVMYGGVAHNFSAQQCSRFGVSRLSLLLTYEEAADLQVDHAAPEGTFIEVPGDSGAVEPKLFSACTVENLRQAIQRKRTPGSSDSIPEEAQAQVRQYREAVTSRFAKGEPVRVSVRKRRGQVYITFRDVPLSKVGTLAEVLGDGLTEVRAVA